MKGWHGMRGGGGEFTPESRDPGGVTARAKRVSTETNPNHLPSPCWILLRLFFFLLLSFFFFALSFFFSDCFRSFFFFDRGGAIGVVGWRGAVVAGRCGGRGW